MVTRIPFAQCRDVPPPVRPGHGDLVDQRDAAAPESCVVGLPHGRGTNDIRTASRDKARVVRFGVIG
jgi:hypothetical protein